MSEQNQPAIPDTPQTTVPEGAAAGETKPVSLADDALIEYKVNGETKTGKWSELRGSMIPAGAAFTQKMQSLADQRREFEAQQAAFATQRDQVEQLRQQLVGIQQDPQKLAAMYLASVAATRAKEAGQAPAFDPNQFAQGLSAQLQNQMQQQFQAFQEQQAAAKIESDLDTFTSGLLKEEPLLAAIPGVSELVFGEVLKMGPSNIGEAKDYAAKVVKAFSEKLETSVQENKKQAAVARAKALSGIEPKGGTAVKPKARTYNGIDDPARLSDMTEFFKQVLAQDDEA